MLQSTCSGCAHRQKRTCRQGKHKIVRLFHKSTKGAHTKFHAPALPLQILSAVKSAQHPSFSIVRAANLVEPKLKNHFFFLSIPGQSRLRHDITFKPARLRGPVARGAVPPVECGADPPVSTAFPPPLALSLHLPAGRVTVALPSSPPPHRSTNLNTETAIRSHSSYMHSLRVAVHICVHSHTKPRFSV